MNDALRSDIARAALAVARRIHDGGFAAVIVSGGSHQLSRSLLALGWGVLYPGVAMPKVFVLDSRANRLLYKWTGKDEEAAQELKEWMKTHMPELESYKDSPLCLVDDFALTGFKYQEVRRILKGSFGFRNISFAFFAAKEDAELEDAFVGIRSADAVAELRHLGEHIQGKEDAAEMLGEIRESARALRGSALGELRDIGKRMK